jgi:ABC-type transport system substrate-binding protein
VLLPALATNWTTLANGDGTYDLTFQLRENVKFHDGQPWDAAACKVNFDNVFARALAATYHSWYDLPSKAVRWRVAGPLTFVVTLSSAYYPAMPEFAIIRPLRFLSPAAFVPGAFNNSCPASRGNVSAGGSWVFCSGTLAPYGTGPWIFDVRRRAGPLQASGF